MIKNTAIRTFMVLSVLLGLLCARILALLVRRQPHAGLCLLVVRLDQTLGDSAMNSPLLRELRHAYPDANITLVVHPRIQAMVQHCPYVNHITTYDWGSSLPKSLLVRHWLSLKFCWTHFRLQQPDIAIVPRFDEDHHAGFIALFSGAKRRIAYTEKATQRKQVLNAGFDMLYTEILPALGLKHEVERNLDIVRHLGFQPADMALEFWGAAPDEAYAQQLLNEHVPAGSMLIGLGLSGGYSILKRWPLQYYVQLAGLLQEKHKDRELTILLVGGKDDTALGAQFEANFPGKVVNMIGKTSIAQMAALLRHCDRFIGNDSGAMHIAAASGIPVTGIFGSSCHHRFSAWGRRCESVSLELPCGPCGQGHIIDRCSTCIYPSPKCMDELKPAYVLQHVGQTSMNNHASADH